MSIIDLEKKKRQIELLERKRQLQYELPHLYGFKLYTWQKEFINSHNKANLLCASNQIGKAVKDDTPIPTPMGFIKIGEIKVGDLVFGRDGKPAEVIDIPFRGKSLCYRVGFDDGSSVVISEDHLWIVKTPSSRFKKTYKIRHPRAKDYGETVDNPAYNQWSVLSTKDIIKIGGHSPKPSQRCSIPVCSPVEYKKCDELFDPYLVGLLIGDGSLTKDGVVVCAPDQEIHEYVKARYSCRIVPGVSVSIHGLIPTFKKIGLVGTFSETKFIPRKYLESSVDDRTALLAGLMDTDGTAYGRGVVSYSTSSERLKDEFIELVCSLGGKTFVKEKPAPKYSYKGEQRIGRKAYEIRISLPFNPFRLTRKAKRWAPCLKSRHERVIYNIEPLGDLDCVCLTVGNKDGSFLITRDHIVTHNSSANILKWIHWATEPKLWPILWPHRRPQQFWVLMPSKDMITTEFRTKWEKEFLPRGRAKEVGQYSWDAELRAKNLWAIHFKQTKISIYTHTYEQDVHNLQAGTVDAMFVDEEPPWELMPELLMRLAGTSGYFNSVMTPTRGQDQWRRAFEVRGEGEIFPDAYKRRVSVYDCLTYDDGTPSTWTHERINRMINQLGSQQEIDLRIYGKFVSQEGLRVPAFDREKNVVFSAPDLGSDWLNYAGVDIGSGGNGHPPAIVFLKVSPDFKKAYVSQVWKGEAAKTYTVTDVIDQYMEMKAGMQMTGAYYDWASAEFGIVSGRTGLSFEKADKSRDSGFALINSLFKNEMIAIIANDGYLGLVNELISLRHDQSKKSHDDATDAFRYAVNGINWNFEGITGEKIIEGKQKSRINERQLKPTPNEQHEVEFWDPASEISEFNSLYGDDDFHGGESW